jgi:hypothetical protein
MRRKLHLGRDACRHLHDYRDVNHRLRRLGHHCDHHGDVDGAVAGEVLKRGAGSSARISREFSIFNCQPMSRVVSDALMGRPSGEN